MKELKYIRYLLPPILCILTFQNVIEKWIVDPLWNTLDLEESLWLDISSVVLCGWLIYEGAKRADKKLSKREASIYFLFCVLYIIFIRQDDWRYLKLFGVIEIWPCFLLSLPIGWIFGKLFYQCRADAQKKDDEEQLPPGIAIIEDLPLIDSYDDILCYDNFAKRIARTVNESNIEKSFSFGITAEWGAGKTSMMNLIKNHLRDSIIVDFNPRSSASFENMQNDLLNEIRKGLGKNHCDANSAFGKYQNYLGIVVGESIWAKLAAQLSSDIKDNPKSEIERIIRDVNRKIVVFIDDFDRLTGEEILEVLKLIDKNASFTNTFFITAYDKEYVNQVLNAFFNTDLNRDYSDKYFNFEVKLPASTSKQRFDFFVHELDKMAEERLMAFDKKDIIKAQSVMSRIIGLCLPTIRDVKRYLSMSISNIINIQQEVVLSDFMLLSLIEYCYPDEYRDLRKGLFTIRRKFEMMDESPNYFLKKDEHLKNSKCKNIVSFLFPDDISQTDNHERFGYKHLAWIRSFDKYFYASGIVNLSIEDLNPLLNKDMTIDEFKGIVEKWTNTQFKMDLADFVIYQRHSNEYGGKLADYLRLLSWSRTFCPSKDLISELWGYYAKGTEDAFMKEYSLGKVEYENILMSRLTAEHEFEVNSILLGDLLVKATSEVKPILLVFDIEILQSLALHNMDLAISAMEEKRASVNVVYEAFKANVKSVNNIGQVSITDEAINHMKTEIKNNPLPYLKSMVRHNVFRDNSNDIEFEFNKKFPLVELFHSGFYELMVFLLDVDSDDNKVKKAKEVVDTFFRLFVKNKYKSYIVPVNTINGNGIKNGNYDAYYEILSEYEKERVALK